MIAIGRDSNILLMRQIPIYRDEHVETLGSQSEQFTVLNGYPSHLSGGAYVMTNDGA